MVYFGNVGAVEDVSHWGHELVHSGEVSHNIHWTLASKVGDS